MTILVVSHHPDPPEAFTFVSRLVSFVSSGGLAGLLGAIEERRYSHFGLLAQFYPGPRMEIADMTTNASARGKSSVSVKSMRASQPSGVMRLSRSAAPPVSSSVGRPDGKLMTP